MVFSLNNAHTYVKVQLWMVGTRELNMSMMLFDSKLHEMSRLSSVNGPVLSSNAVNAL
jgi:hypothetical protein